MLKTTTVKSQREETIRIDGEIGGDILCR